MANLKIFVSSTCYDLNIVRSELRNFIVNLGYEPVMSDYSDVLYDYRIHTHTSCIKEVSNCDMLIMIMGSRFGGKSIPKALELIDFELIKKLNSSNSVLDNKNNFSITQLEVMKAIECGMPIFTFVDGGVLHDHLVYEKNKEKDIINSLDFPSIEKKETAKYIFEFINFMRHRIENNNVIEFTKMEDIENFLKKQWSGLFQRLLSEQKIKKVEDNKMEYISNEIADIKTAIMTSITSTGLKETAKGALKYRNLIQFFGALNNDNLMTDLLSVITWEELLKRFKIVEVRAGAGHITYSGNPRAILILEDHTYYETRFSLSMLNNSLCMQWKQFSIINDESKKAIIDAILDIYDRGPMTMVRYYSEEYCEDEVVSQVMLNEETACTEDK